MKLGKKTPSQDELQRLQSAPVVDLIIRYDGRTKQIGVLSIGGQLTTEVAYQLLEMARGYIRAQELAALKANGSGPTPEAGQADHSADNKG